MPAIRDLIVRGSPRTAWDTDTFYAAPSRASDSESESGIFGLISVTSVCPSLRLIFQKAGTNWGANLR